MVEWIQQGTCVLKGCRVYWSSETTGRRTCCCFGGRADNRSRKRSNPCGIAQGFCVVICRALVDYRRKLWYDGSNYIKLKTALVLEHRAVERKPDTEATARSANVTTTIVAKSR